MFLELLGEVIARFNWLCHAYCLMGNHYDLLIETSEGSLSRGMRELNGCYTQDFNRRHRLVGHLMQGRYKVILVERESYLLKLSRYIVLNPVRTNMVPDPASYRWGSYGFTCGVRIPEPKWLQTDWVLSQFGGHCSAARYRYVEFVKEGINGDSPWGEVKGQLFLGKAAYSDRISRGLKGKEGLVDTSRVQRFAHRPLLEVMFSGDKLSVEQRNARIWQASREYGYSNSEIGRVTGCITAP